MQRCYPILHLRIEVEWMGIVMDNSEARAVLAQHLAIYRQYSHSDLTKLVGNNSVLEVCGPLAPNIKSRSK